MDSFGKYFIAIDIPSKLKEKIWESVKEILTKTKFSITPKEKYHITVFYIGYDNLEDALTLFEEIPKLEAFELELKGIGYFSNRVIYVNVIDKEKQLSKIHNLYSAEKITPHLTIARNKILPKENFQRIIKRLRSLNINEKFIVQKITLFESIPKNEKTEYVIIKEKKF